MAFDLGIKIRAQVAGQQDVDQLKNSVDGLKGASGGLGGAMGSLSGLATAAAGALAAINVTQFARDVINATDALKDMADRTGMSVTTLSELDYAAKMNGTTLDAVQSALGRISDKAVEAATGNKEASVAFDALGVSVKDADGNMRPALDIIEDVGSAIAGIEDPTLKSSLAISLFGKSGTQLLPLIQNMGTARQEARQLGLTVGEDFANQAGTFNDNVDRLSMKIQALSRSMLGDLLPTFNKFFDQLQTGTQVFGSFGAALRSLGFASPWKSDTEQVEYYTERVRELRAALTKRESEGGFYAASAAKQLRGELDEAQKRLEYFERMTGRFVGGGRGNVIPPLAVPDQPDAQGVLKRLGDARGDGKSKGGRDSEADRAAQEQARLDAQRVDFLMRQADEVYKLANGQDALLREEAKRIGLTQEQIAILDVLIAKRNELKAAEADGKEEADDYAAIAKLNLQAEADLRREVQQVIESTRTPQEKINDQIERYTQLLAQGSIDSETFGRAVSKAFADIKETGTDAQDQFADLKDAIQRVGENFTSTFTSMVMTGKLKFRELVDSLIADLVRLTIQRKVTEPLFAMLEKFGVAAMTQMFAPNTTVSNGYVSPEAMGIQPQPMPRAAGGPVVGGSPYFVGESGMELFVPKQSGSIIPAHAVGGGVTITQNINASPGTDYAMVMQAARAGASLARAEYIDARRRRAAWAT